MVEVRGAPATSLETTAANSRTQPRNVPRCPARGGPPQPTPDGISKGLASSEGDEVPYVYIVRCSDDTYYVGSTWDLEKRLAQHASGIGGAAYTRRRRPVRLVYFEQSDRIEDAYAREKQIQNWGRAKRIALIEGRPEDLPGLSRPKGD